MRTITLDGVMGWIEQCDRQLELLENAKIYLRYAYTERDLINYFVEEDLKHYFNQLIMQHKAKRTMLTKILTYATTDDETVSIEMFDNMFPSYVVNRLPEELRKEFINSVYDV